MIYTYFHDDGHYGGSDTDLLYEHDTPEQAIAELASMGSYDKILVLTDHPDAAQMIAAAQDKAEEMKRNRQANEELNRLEKFQADRQFYHDLMNPR